MTTTTEQAKREMYHKLAELRGKITINYSIKDMLVGADEFEHAMEEYLEGVRSAFDILIEQNSNVRASSTEIQERLRSVDGAYHDLSVRHGIAQEEIAVLRSAIDRQNAAIGELYMQKVAK